MTKPREALPFTADEESAIRRWHKRRSRRRRITLTIDRLIGAQDHCEQGDPWPCRNARWLATLDRLRAALEAPSAGPETPLDAAWAAVEAALPAGWGIGIEPSPRGYEVGAGRNQWHTWTGKAYPTLAEALDDLAAALRDQAR